MKNPLAVLFGEVLRRLRATNTLSSADVARRIGISDSAYRRVESGGAVLQPMHTPRLIDVFGSIVWIRVLAYLTCAQSVDALISEGDTPAWKLATAVAALDAELRYTINKLRDVWTHLMRPGVFLDPVRPDDEYIRPAIHTVHRYLEGESLSGKPSGESSGNLAKWAAYAPAWVSPIQLDMVLQEMETMRYFPGNVPPKQFVNWESRNYSAFAHVYAFASDLDEIARTANQYRWPYLTLETFGDVHFLTPNGPRFLEQRENLVLAIARAASGSPTLRRTIVSKIKIKTIDKSATDELQAVLRYDRDQGALAFPENMDSRTVLLENAWLYELKRNDISIGFADSSKDFISITLSKGEVGKLLPMLVHPWR